MNNQASWRLSGDIVVMSPNLSLDALFEIPELVVGASTRAKASALSAGGKGANSARTLALLGDTVRLFGFLSDDVHGLYEACFPADNVLLETVRPAGRTRLSAIIVGEARGEATIVNGASPEVLADGWQSLVTMARGSLENARVLICSGSLPSGVESSGYSSLIMDARQTSVPCLVDATGDTLLASARFNPTVLKVNLGEASDVLGLPSDSGDGSMGALAAAAEGMYALTDVGSLVTSRLGCAFVGRAERFSIAAPTVTTVNEAGAGDTFLGALASSIAKGDDIAKAALAATAVASASVETLQPGHFVVKRAAELHSTLTLT